MRVGIANGLLLALRMHRHSHTITWNRGFIIIIYLFSLEYNRMQTL